MLGRLGEVARFAEVRALASEGYPDELGLAAASLGEEARWYLPGHAPAGSTIVDDATAITLYARQARFDPAGAISLLQVARTIIDDGGERLAKAAATPIGQRLLNLYGATRAVERPNNTNRALDVLVALDHVDAADQLAAALYGQGRVDEAARIVQQAPDTPLATWVRAKLAMRAGNLDEARTLLAKASAAFPVVPYQPGEDDPQYQNIHARVRVVGELGVLALTRREYAFALERFLEDDVWWHDAAHVAEQVLTVDELIAFLADHPTHAAPRPPHKANDDEHNSIERPSLRSLLARRLVRADRLDEAVAYVDDPVLLATLKQLQSLHADAFADTAHLPTKLRQAANLHVEAKLVRTAGLQLMGSELGPDWAIYDGVYEPYVPTDDDGHPLPPQPPSPLMSTDEQQRVSASAVVPAARFHYRFKAMKLLEQAADLVPPRSQAFAALLCQATHYGYRSPDDVQRLWHRYVKEGPVVPFTNAFGDINKDCPAPDFDAVAEREAAVRAARLRKYGLGGGAAFALVFVLFMAHRRYRQLS
jgi:tetratricopeptide (TPR) repeat protein